MHRLTGSLKMSLMSWSSEMLWRLFVLLNFSKYLPIFAHPVFEILVPLNHYSLSAIQEVGLSHVTVMTFSNWRLFVLYIMINMMPSV